MAQLMFPQSWAHDKDLSEGYGPMVYKILK